MRKTVTIFSLILLAALTACNGQKHIPSIYSNIQRGRDGKLYIELQGTKFLQEDIPQEYSLTGAIGKPAGTETGIAFDFADTSLSGILYYGFIHYNDSRHPLTVYFKYSSLIRKGKAHIDVLNNLDREYDMVGWQESAIATLGYRLTGTAGNIIYDGRVTIEGTGPFEVGTTVLEGPFVNLMEPEGMTVCFKTNKECIAGIRVDGHDYRDGKACKNHVITIQGLTPDTGYEYTLTGVSQKQSYTFRTAPGAGSRTAFAFAYASDSRSGQGGGERDVYGSNAYIMKKILALTTQQGARFLQFTGDMINGYLTDTDATHLQYANWKRAVEPFWHHLPVYLGMGNHEAVEYRFREEGGQRTIKIDRFPFETTSAEALYAENFTLPQNGPESEDGAAYDPDPRQTDFPTYKENVYYYIYDNVAMIVLNSDYLYASTAAFIQVSSGNLHGYIMDRQLAWLENTLEMLEQDEHIDHVFVTQHTPAFPNGGHAKDDMWYFGNNDWRPSIAGRPLPRGIIERRNEYLDLLINRSSKVVAMLTGDEHNYNRMKITSGMPIHPENYIGERLEVGRDIYQINNGAAGAPYYAQEVLPWSDHTKSFTTQNALVIIYVEGSRVSMEVLNPDTLERIDTAILRE